MVSGIDELVSALARQVHQFIVEGWLRGLRHPVANRKVERSDGFESLTLCQNYGSHEYAHARQLIQRRIV